MRIVVDLQACQSSSRLGGIGRYSFHLVEAMARHCGDHELWIVLNDLMPEAIPQLYDRLSTLIPRHRIQVFQAPGPVAENNPANHHRARVAELIREHAIHRLQPDIVHVASLIEGLGDDVISSVGRLVPGDNTAVTLYDLIPLVNAEHYLRLPIVSEHYRRKLDELKRAGGWLAISDYSRREAIDELGIDPERIVNIAAGVDPRFRPFGISPDRAAELRRRHGLRGGFLLFTGSFDQRKNHARLIEAYARLPAPLRAQRQLLIIGNGWDSLYAHLRSVGRAAGLNDHEIVFAGHVPDDDLLALYNLADLFVFPSLCEGYGLPVLEAMACGIPSIASDNTSLPEVVGRADALFDPTDVDSIAAKMQQVLTDEAFRRDLIEHGLVYSRRFTWDASAKRALAAFEAQYGRVRSNPRPTSASLRDATVSALRELERPQPRRTRNAAAIAAALAANERCLVDDRRQPPRIGWITTWNTRCGIAMYARYLAGAHVADYRILAPFEPQPALADEPSVIRCWHPGLDDLRTLAECIDEERLDTLVIQFNYGFFDFAAFGAFLREMIATGRRLHITLHSTTDTPDKSLAWIADSLALCDSILVHSPNDAAVLARIGLSANVERFPHGVPDVAPAQVALDIPAGRFVIASYGFFLPHKGLFELIDAVQRLRDEYGLDIHLLMVNARYPVDISQALIDQAHERLQSAGLTDRVTLITDFLDDGVSLGYLARADLVVYAYQHTGESSSAAVRLGLAARRPVAVTPLAIFDDVAEVVHRLPGTDPEAIARGIAELRARLRDPDEALRRTTDSAADWFEANRYSRLADRLWKRLNTV